MTNINRFGFFYNPALSSFDYAQSYISLGHRSQWINVYEAPRYSFISYSGRDISRSYSYDTYILNKTIGIYSYTGIGVNYSYKLDISDQTQFSLGLSLGGYRFIIDNSKINDISNTINISSNQESYYFNLNIGSVLRIKNIKIGLSGNNVIGKKITQEGLYHNDIEYKFYGGYFLGIKYSKKAVPSYGGSNKGGYLRDSKGGVDFMPIVLVSYSKNIGLNYGAYLMSEIENLFRIQAGYDKLKGLSLLGGISISDNFEIYYSHDFGTQNYLGYSVNSHEISLVYNILDGKKNTFTNNSNGSELSESKVNELINKSKKEDDKEIDIIMKKNDKLEKEIEIVNKKIKQIENNNKYNEELKDIKIENKEGIDRENIDKRVIDLKKFTEIYPSRSSYINEMKQDSINILKKPFKLQKEEIEKYIDKFYLDSIVGNINLNIDKNILDIEKSINDLKNAENMNSILKERYIIKIKNDIEKLENDINNQILEVEKKDYRNIKVKEENKVNILYLNNRIEGLKLKSQDNINYLKELLGSL